MELSASVALSPEDGMPGNVSGSVRITNWRRGSGLPVERVLLDLHSGRIFGKPGVYVVDAAAILFLVLAASGVWLWGKRRASARAHARHKQHGTVHQP